MTINLLNKTDRYMEFKDLRAKLESFRHIENVLKYCNEQKLISCIRMIDQYFALSDINSHAYYGDPVNDVYKDYMIEVTGVDNLMKLVKDTICDCEKYVPGGQIVN